MCQPPCVPHPKSPGNGAPPPGEPPARLKLPQIFELTPNCPASRQRGRTLWSLGVPPNPNAGGTSPLVGFWPCRAEPCQGRALQPCLREEPLRCRPPPPPLLVPPPAGEPSRAEPGQQQRCTVSACGTGPGSCETPALGLGHLSRALCPPPPVRPHSGVFLGGLVLYRAWIPPLPPCWGCPLFGVEGSRSCIGPCTPLFSVGCPPGGVGGASVLYRAV